MIEWLIRLLERRSRDHERRVQESLPHVMRAAEAALREGAD